MAGNFRETVRTSSGSTPAAVTPLLIQGRPDYPFLSLQDGDTTYVVHTVDDSPELKVSLSTGGSKRVSCPVASCARQG